MHLVRHRWRAAPTSAVPARSARETAPSATVPRRRLASGGGARRATRPRPRPRVWSPAPARRWCQPRTGAARAVGAARPRSDRRQPAAVLQPRHRGADERRPRHVRGGGFVAFLWPQDRRLRRQGRGRQARRHHGGHHRRQRLLLRARGPHLDHRSTRPTPSRRPRRSTPRRSCSGMRAGHRSRCTRSARTSAAACRSASAASGSSARATARSTTASVRRRAARRRAAWTASPSRSRGRRRHGRHRHRRRRARRSAPTPPARRPRARTASGGRSTDARHWQPPSIAGSSSRSSWSGWLVYCLAQRQRGAPRARLGDRAGPQPQAVLRRRGARGPAPRARASSSACCCSSIVVVGLPLYWVLEPTRQAGAVAELGRARSSNGARGCSRPPPTAASTAPAATAA